VGVNHDPQRCALRIAVSFLDKKVSTGSTKMRSTRALLLVTGADRIFHGI